MKYTAWDNAFLAKVAKSVKHIQAKYGVDEYEAVVTVADILDREVEEITAALAEARLMDIAE